MSIARFIMSFPELVQQHRRQMLLLLLARFGIRDDGVVREADLRKLLDAMLPYYVPAMGEVNIDDIGMPVTGRPRKLTTAMYEEIAARVADGMSIKAACRSLAGDDPVRAHALAAQFHRMRKLQERYLSFRPASIEFSFCVSFFFAGHRACTDRSFGPLTGGSAMPELPNRRGHNGGPPIDDQRRARRPFRPPSRRSKTAPSMSASA